MKVNRFQLALTSIFLLPFFTGCVQHSRDDIEENELSLKLEETLEYLNDLASERKRDDNFHYQRAKVYYELGKYNKARTDINKSIQLNSSIADYYMLNGRIEKALNNPENAIKSLLIAEKIGARDTDLYEILASEYLRLGQPEKAKEASDRLIEVKSNANAYILRGNIFLAIQDSANAIVNYTNALRFDDSGIEPYLKLSSIYRERSNYEKALDYIGRFLTREPNNEVALTQEARLLSDIGNYDSALFVYQKLLTKDSSNSNLFFEVSNVYFGKEVYDSAAYYAQKAYIENNNFMDALLVGARALNANRQYDSAIYIYEKILSRDSTYDIASNELDILKRKVAYLWQLERLREKKDSVRQNLPPTIEKKNIEN